jgi:hypothetical protein
MTTGRPLDPPGGQDDPPDPLTAVRALIGFLDDLTGEPLGPDLTRRRVALRRALGRLRDHLEAGDPDPDRGPL